MKKCIQQFKNFLMDPCKVVLGFGCFVCLFVCLGFLYFFKKQGNYVERYGKILSLIVK